MRTTKTQNACIHGSKRWLLTLLAAVLLLPGLSLRAQVTVGAGDPPQDFSILEIVSNNKGGLRLPRLTQEKRQELEDSPEFQTEKNGKARGLMIFNFTTKCVDTWNGEEWISMCAEVQPVCIPVTGVSIGGATSYTEGGNISLTANITPADATSVTCKWYKAGVEIPGATGTTYNKISCASSDAGSYTVAVSNSCTTEQTSTAKSITVSAACTPITAVSISGGGTTITQYATTAITLTANVTGGAATSYQWYLGGSAISGATSQTYSVPQSVKDVAGTKSYTVKASNACSDITSTAANVVVTGCTKITAVSISGGTTITQYATTAITLTANVTGGAATSYQWYLGGSAISGATSQTYSVPQSVKDVAGTKSYTVKASNACSDITSTAVNVTVTECTKPTVTITSSVADGKIIIGQPFTLTANPTGTAPYEYQWKKDGVNISGATSKTYTVSAMSSSNAGIYSVTVKNACGSANATSNLTIEYACGAKTTSGTWLKFMCHNLGADESLDPFVYNANILGDLYQWGRPKDGHEKRGSGTTSSLASSNTPGNSNFIKAPNSPYDWRSGGGNTSRWGDGTQNENMPKAANDPCPAGWKVPSQKQWQSIFKSSGNGAPGTATANTWTWTGNGYKVGDALYLPAGGYRYSSDASLLNVGGYGYYWSSTVYDGTYSYFLGFLSSAVNPAYNGSRAYGRSVRCVSEF